MQKIQAQIVLFISLLIVSALPLRADQEPRYPDMIGTWAGSYEVAFPKSHSRYPDGVDTFEIALEVYKQEANLIWATNRWRHVEASEWFEEETTGTFTRDEPNVLYLSEKAQAPADWASSGIFRTRVAGDHLYMTYISIGAGIAFSAILDRRQE